MRSILHGTQAVGAAHAGRSRGQAPLDAGCMADNPPRAPPAAILPWSRARGRKMVDRCRTPAQPSAITPLSK